MIQSSTIARVSLTATGVAATALAGAYWAGCSQRSDPRTEERVGAVQSALGTVNWLTRSYDTARTSANTSESVLTQSNVNSNSFGKLFPMWVDDIVYAQPLLLTPSPPLPGVSSLLFVATANNTVYAFVGDTGQKYWSVNFNGAGHPPKASDLSAGTAATCGNFPGNVGIVGTPVIDPGTSTLYVVTHTVESTGVVYRLRALDITTGHERSNSNLRIFPTGTGVTFTSSFQNQRPGLAFANGIVYVGFAGYCDAVNSSGTYEGWLVGYDTTKTPMAQTGAFVTESVPGTSPQLPVGWGGIWQGGNAPAIDSSGNLYVSIGNGDNGVVNGQSNNIGQSVVKLAPNTLTRRDYFTPFNFASWNGSNDKDLGSVGPTLFSGSTVVQGSKLGLVFLLNQGALGGFSSNDKNVLQVFQASQTTGCSGSLEIQNGVVAWNPPTAGTTNLYVWAECDALRLYQYTSATGKFNTTPIVAPSSVPNQGGNMSLSANGSTSGTGVLWVTTPLGSPGALWALNAENLNPLWSSSTSPLDSIVSGVHWNSPVIANGRVYVATGSDVVWAYGNLSYPNHGFMILSDTNSTLAVNAWGGAANGTALRLNNNCTISNRDCTWSYQNGMIVSDTDPTLAINAWGGAQNATVLKLNRACTPSNTDCTWTYRHGEFISDSNTSLAINAVGGAAQGTTLELAASCSASNTDCTWTLPHMMISSKTNSTVDINAVGGAAQGTTLLLTNVCTLGNSDCTFTLSKGMLTSDTNSSLAANAWGGAANGTALRLNNTCTSTNADCTWSWSHGELISDHTASPSLVVYATGGAAQGTTLHLSNSCSSSNSDCVFSALFARH